MNGKTYLRSTLTAPPPSGTERRKRNTHHVFTHARILAEHKPQTRVQPRGDLCSSDTSFAAPRPQQLQLMIQFRQFRQAHMGAHAADPPPDGTVNPQHPCATGLCTMQAAQRCMSPSTANWTQRPTTNGRRQHGRAKHTCPRPPWPHPPRRHPPLAPAHHTSAQRTATSD